MVPKHRTHGSQGPQRDECPTPILGLVDIGEHGLHTGQHQGQPDAIQAGEANCLWKGSHTVMLYGMGRP